MRAMVSVLSLVVGACTVAPHWSKETSWPGSGVGRIENRGDSPSGPVGGPQKGLPLVTVFGEPVVRAPYVTPFRTPHTFHYQVRSPDGTLHVIASEAEFEVGTCIAFSGYADGPSRTHWSLGRATL